MANRVKLRTTEASRKTTWLELFYDLIYVVVIAKLAHFVAEPHHGHLGLPDYLRFVALFVPVWWAWTGHMMFADRFDPDDTVHRVLTLVQMFGAVVMAVFIEGALEAGANGFTLSYVTIRAVLLGMYARVYLTAPEVRPVVVRFLTGFGAGAALWLISVFFDPPVRYVLWTAGLLIDFATPWLSHRLLSEVSVHASHLPERLGLFTLIVLGESVAGVVSGLESVPWTLRVIAAALAGFLLLGSIWWLYFESLEDSLIGGKYRSGQLAIYGHLPVYIGLVTVAAGIRHGILGELPANEYGWLLCGGLLLFLVPLQCIHGVRLVGHAQRRFAVRNLTLDCVLLALGLLGQLTQPVWMLTMVALVYCAYVVVESRLGLIATAREKAA